MGTYVKDQDYTNDATEEAQAGGVPFTSIAWTLPPGGGQGDAQADGPMELASAWLHRHHGAERGLVP